MANLPINHKLKGPVSINQLREHAREHRCIEGFYTDVDGTRFYKIENVDLMPPFFMSLISGSDHWAFIASNGAITAGRRNSQSALFPYYSSDKLLDLVESTGPLTIIQVDQAGSLQNWTPFATRESEFGNFEISRHLYKNALGTEVIFEEHNVSLDLLFRYSWRTGEHFGFIRTCHLANFSDEHRSIRILDGIQNVLPSGIDSDFQLRFSNLGDAYKKCERVSDQPLAVYYLSSIPSDRAEPSEGLRATTVWQQGLESPEVLLSDAQLSNFRQGKPVQSEQETRGRRGCYLACQSITLAAHDSVSWSIVADVDKDQTDVVELQKILESGERENRLFYQLKADFENNQASFRRITDSADGAQCSGLKERADRHRSNVTFNVMRGGVPLDGYFLPRADFVQHVGRLNHRVLNQHDEAIQSLPDRIEFRDLIEFATQRNDADLLRIAREYLPLAFSRRHGDPTRPWNIFSIDTRGEDGSIKLNYQGNWRDIFQNWEALGLSFPRFFNGMLLRFVNASTIDGNNPYRVSKSGFDWEKPDPKDPWANIGYWGDHQIIYQLKLIEHARKVSPKSLNQLLVETNCVFANVPYRIGRYEQMLKDSQNTITYDFELADQVDQRVAEMGSDGQLVLDQNGDPTRVTLFEKLLLSGVTKAANLIPAAGIWLNTQRPEWNDANNALVGIGASVVTACHLRRYFSVLDEWISNAFDASASIDISEELHDLMRGVGECFSSFTETAELSDHRRRELVDRLQELATIYRQRVYDGGLSGPKVALTFAEFSSFAKQCIEKLEQTIAANQREDHLYHSYNLISFGEDSNGPTLSVDYLYEMLEGQVAVLSSGMLTPGQSVDVLNALRESAMYRRDQNSYMLYPDRQLKSFLQKNQIAESDVALCPLLQAMLDQNDVSIVRRDIQGTVRFNGDFRNSADVREALSKHLESSSDLPACTDDQVDTICKVFESTFEHHRFTGRSGTFFGYEGLGSIYWHMVSKLAVAILENYQVAQSLGDLDAMNSLEDSYRHVQLGLGVDKKPNEYGAFPTDPYSHTPGGAGVKQPGMTGQVKEDILTRFAELGIRIEDGQIHFETSLFQFEELVASPTEFEYFDIHGEERSIEVKTNEFAFTFAQVPIVYSCGDRSALSLEDREGNVVECENLTIPAEWANSIFDRDGRVRQVQVQLKRN